MRRRFIKVVLFTAICLTWSFGIDAQQRQALTREEKKAIMRDTLDGQFDFSRYLIEAKGFIPIPVIITEPALGGFGLFLAPVFLTPKHLPGYNGYIPPDITGVAGMYTANDSWFAGGFRMGSFLKAGLRYRAMVGYTSLNLSFYRDLPNLDEQEFEFNIDALPVYLSLSRRLINQDLYLGLQYLYSKTEVAPLFDGDLPEFVPRPDLAKNTGSLGTFLDWDKRSNMFTPDKGTRIYAIYNVNAHWTGSEYESERINTFVNWFSQIKPHWISGLRAEVQQLFGEPPFYTYPAINMRGVPAAKYQGNTTLLLETEQRYDLNLRWSVLGFVGYAQTFFKDESISEGKSLVAGGAGFRYLIARAFSIRSGIDIATGPDGFAWYIVFGHNWNR